MSSPYLRLVVWSTIFAALVLFLNSCATDQQAFVLSAVGPQPGLISHGKEGILQVFTATITRNDGGTPYYPHSSYRIYTPDGTFVRFVRNHTTSSDQRPEPVPLTTGDYYIIALSVGCGVVKVHVVLKG